MTIKTGRDREQLEAGGRGAPASGATLADDLSNERARHCAVATGTVIRPLPDQWVCEVCGGESWAWALVCAVSAMDEDERRTLECYGADESQFTTCDEILLCGCCYSSRRVEKAGP
jgi:hypothetical protein